MNMLTLFIYLSDVLPTLSSTAALFSVIGGASSGIGFVIYLGCWSDNRSDPALKPALRILKYLFAMSLLSVFIAVVIPSQRAMYMMAASEAGEAVYQSEDVQSVLGDVQNILKKKLQEYVDDGKERTEEDQLR